MSRVFVIDVEKCNGCYDCLIACNDETFGDELKNLDAPMPSLVQYIMKIEQHLYGEPPSVRQFFIPKMCMHCGNAPCMQVCPVDIISRRDNGMVVIDYTKCIGCRMCMYACPYQAVTFNKKFNVVQKCSGCANLVEKGLKPRCEASCERKAIMSGEEEEMKNLIEECTQFIPEEGMKPKIYYKGIPENYD